MDGKRSEQDNEQKKMRKNQDETRLLCDHNRYLDEDNCNEKTIDYRDLWSLRKAKGKEKRKRKRKRKRKKEKQSKILINRFKLD